MNDHVVIVGGSFGGVIAGRVLSERFDKVTIIERDELPTGPVVRKGVPQGPHVHGILKLGRDIMDGLFPGFVEETQKEGALLFDIMDEGAGFGPNGWGIRGHTSVRGYGVRRPLLEFVARRRLLQIPNVTVVHGRVDGLIVGADRRIEGVKVSGDAGSSEIRADLVVDTSGRGSGSVGWLEHEGFETPAETIVNGFGGYASRLLKVPDDAWPREGLRSIAALPMPSNTKGAILYPQDNGLHVVSLFGHSRDYPPSDEDGFYAFLEQGVTPFIHEVVAKSEPVSEIKTSRATANRWRHFEHLESPPVGFVVVGDAAAAFNPMAGQGISTSCLAGVTLGATFDEVDGDLTKLTPLFQTRQAEKMAYPWSVAVGFDSMFPATVGDRPAPTPEQIETGKLLQVLGQVATVDLEVAEQLLLANHLFDRSALTTPEMVAKADAWVAEGRVPPHLDPTTFPST